MSMLGLVVCGSRTWMCTMAAPALAASSEELAICSGVTGTAGLRPGVSAEPVTAHEMMTLRCMPSPQTGRVGEPHRSHGASCEVIAGRQRLVAAAGERAKPAHLQVVPNYSAASAGRLAKARPSRPVTYSPIANDAVSPGDSMPNKLTRLGTP